ncbi:phosphoinositide 3-kinase adapter protein 1-like isoform X3 [Apostichopus japonicus]|uniref:phosphoinositide 3-kinase adapter protein 1-like isoform X3 n=1 Tax=Stichopus japonicus TaxID=307972 RepID=UPI003AB72E08
MDPETSTRLYDFTILYMEDALEWCEYLFDLFSPYDVHQNSENITEFPTQDGTLKAITSSFVRIAIISPAFLERCSSELELIIADKPVVGLLCGVSKPELSALELRLPSYKSWTLVDAQEDPKLFTQVTMKVLDEAWKKEYEGDEAWKKEYEGEENTDSLYLTMTGKIPQVSESDADMEDLYVPAHIDHEETSDLYDFADNSNEKLTVVPERIHCNSKEQFLIVFSTDSLNEKDAYLVCIRGSGSSSSVEGTALNPYVLSVYPPKDVLPGFITLEVTHAGNVIGKCYASLVSHLDELAENLKNSLEPMNVMCESLGVSPASINQLDNLLYEHVKNIHDNNMLKDALTTSQEGKQKGSDKLYPTALHFAASFGLKNITNYLLGLPGADYAGTIRNKDNLSPAEMAKKNGHEELSDIMHYPMEVVKKSEGYVTMLHGDKPRYDKPRPCDPHEMHKLLDEGSSIYNVYFPEVPHLRRDESDEDEESNQSYEPLQPAQPLAGPALPSRMNPTSPPSATQNPDENVAAVQDWKIELWRIDQQMLNQEITNEEAHKLFEKWRLTHKDKMPGPSPKHGQPIKGKFLWPSRPASDAMREQRTQSTISRPILASSHSVPQTTSIPYLRAGSVDTSTCDSPQPDKNPSVIGSPSGGHRGSNPPPTATRNPPISKKNQRLNRGKRRSVSVDMNIPPSRPPPPIPLSSPPDDEDDGNVPNRPPPPPPTSGPATTQRPAHRTRPPVALRPDAPVPPPRPVPAPRHGGGP